MSLSDEFVLRNKPRRRKRVREGVSWRPDAYNEVRTEKVWCVGCKRHVLWKAIDFEYSLYGEAFQRLVVHRDCGTVVREDVLERRME